MVALVLQGVDGKGLRPIIEDLRKTTETGIVAVVGVTEDGKAAIAVAVSADLTGEVKASDLVKVAVVAMGGQGGGGKPDFAQGGAPDGRQADLGLEAIRAALSS